MSIDWSKLTNDKIVTYQDYEFNEYQKCFADIKQIMKEMPGKYVLVVSVQSFTSEYWIERDRDEINNTLRQGDVIYRNNEIDNFITRVLSEIKVAELEHRSPMFTY
jgi:hypothetical protein